MPSVYNKIVAGFENESRVTDALISNHPLIYRYMVEMMMDHSNAFQDLKDKVGRIPLNKILSDTLIIFRRQVKHQKIELSVFGEKIFLKRSRTGLLEHLEQLLTSIHNINEYERMIKQSGRHGLNLANGRGYEKILKYRSSVFNTLYHIGCKDESDREEIFNECLVVLWQKLTSDQVGLYFTGKEDKLDNCHVYNKRFYQGSRLITFLTGIAKNIFLNRIKSATIHRAETADLPDESSPDTETDPTENPLFFMFLFFRAFVETRKLRVIISILQYDCGLEDKEVRQMIGINNARIHSCRLRSSFHEWYDQNFNNVHLVYDQASAYLEERKSRVKKLNEKIKYVSLYRKIKIDQQIRLDLFQEEFRTREEFETYHQIFKHLFYLSSAGRSSSLAGLPDEKHLRALMDLYKAGLFALKGPQSLLYLFYYGSEEPENTMITLLEDLHEELSTIDQNQGSVMHLTEQLSTFHLADTTDLTNKLYETNRDLFGHLLTNTGFISMITENEYHHRRI